MGEHPPTKFITDNRFCIWTQFMLISTALTCAAIGSTADNGGNSTIPFFITGFILVPFHLVSICSRIYVLYTIKKVTKRDILKVLTTNTVGKRVWPLAAQIGMVWCIPGMILTGIGGLSCNTEDKNITTNANNCYYEATSNNAPTYKGMAIGLMVCHGISLIWFFFSSCPLAGVHKEIKDDPKPAAPRPAPAASTQPTPSAPSTQAQNKDAVRSEELTREANISELNERENRLKDREQHLNTRERELERKEQQLASMVPPPPPSYDVATAYTFHGENNGRAGQLPPISAEGHI